MGDIPKFIGGEALSQSTDAPPALPRTSPVDGDGPTAADGSQRRPSGRDRKLAWILIGLLTVLAFGLRWWGLRQSIWGDEGFTWLVTGEPTFGGMLNAVRGPYEVTPPFYFILAWLFRRLGDDPLWIRAPSIIAGTALVPFAFLLGRRVVGWRVGLFAGALVALSPFATHYSVEARGYSMLALILAASTLVLLKATSRDSSRLWWLAFALLTTAAMYTHYTSIFVIGAQFLWIVLFHRKSLGWLIAAGVAAGTLFAPWFPELVNDTRSVGSVIIAFLFPMTLGSYAQGLITWIDGLPGVGLGVVPGFVALVILALVGTGILSVFLVRAARSPRLPRPELALLALTAAAAPLGTLGVSLVGRDIFLPRNLMSSLPAVLVLIAWATLRLPRRAASVGACALALAFAIGSIAALQPATARPDFRSAAALLDRQAGPNDVIVDYFSVLGAKQVMYTQYQSDADHVFVYSRSSFLGLRSTEVIETKGRDEISTVRPEQASIEPIASIERIARREALRRGGTDIFAVFLDWPPFGGPIRIPGYVLRSTQVFPGSIPVKVVHFVRAPRP